MRPVSVLTSQKYVPLLPPVAATRTHPAHPAAGAAVYLMLEYSAQRTFPPLSIPPSTRLVYSLRFYDVTLLDARSVTPSSSSVLRTLRETYVCDFLAVRPQEGLAFKAEHMFESFRWSKELLPRRHYL